MSKPRMIRITREELMQSLEANYKLICLELQAENIQAENIDTAKDCARAMLSNIEQWERQGKNE